MKAIENLIGKKIIIRSDRAGVFYGTLNEVESCGDKYTVELINVRRLWYWDGAASLTQLAMEGVNAPQNCKFTVWQDSIVICGVIEILPTTENARKIIEAVVPWKR